MTMMNGFEAGQIDILDEDYYGPPPRFLRERKSADFYETAATVFGEDEEDALPAIEKLKSFLRVWG